MKIRFFQILLSLSLCFTLSAGAVSLSDGDTLSGETYTASGDDESALDLGGSAVASVSDALIAKTGGNASSADAASFRGLNAAVRVYDTASLTLEGCTIEASASNATGVFAYDGGEVVMKDCTVNVTGGGAGGVQVAGGGTLTGENLTVSSKSKAAIRSDRGGGTMILSGGTYTSTGTNGCPVIYSTADITVSDAVCVSEASRAVIIEGKNSVTLENCTLSGNDQSTKANSVKANVLLYQSASGDASVGTSIFTMRRGSMTCLSGSMFYVTNTDSVISLEDAALTLSEDGTLLICSAGRWGKDERNGGNCTLNAASQTLEGTILVDSISSLDLHFTASTYTGAINPDQEGGQVALTMDQDSRWILTGNSFISSFEGDLSCIEAGSYHLYVNGEMTL